MVRISTWIRSVSLFVKALVSAGTIVFFMENLDYKRFSVVCCGFCEVFGIFFCLWAAVNRWKRINGILVVLWSAFLFWEIVNVVLLSKKDRSDLFVSIASTLVILVMVGWNYFDKKNRIQSWPSRDTISNYFDQSKSSLSLQIEPEESQVHQSKEGQDAIVILSFTRKKENEISVSQFQKVRILKQHKSKTLVETTAGQIGFVPTVILK